MGLSPDALLLPDPHFCLVLGLDPNHGPVLCSTCRAPVQHATAGGDSAAGGDAACASAAQLRANPRPLHGPEPPS